MTSYQELRAARPDLFRNEPGGIEILPQEVTAEDARRGAGAVGVVYADPYITVVRDPVRFPDGSPGLYVRVLPSTERPGVVVLPITGDGEVLLIEQYRHATRAWHLEAPRGGGESPDPAADAARELAEETGEEAVELVPLGELHPDTGLLAASVRLYAAHLATRTRQPEEPGVRGAGPEAIRRTVLVTAAEAERMMADGRITDGFTLAVLTRARLAGLLPTTDPPPPDGTGQGPAAP
ncbi:NUDIX hydrolase [Streptomyces palmae]|uniref:NUDIX hydrolase n=1 Tax=Streptomyces palmae TaxID=1701085 RepID=A0A4Z0HEA7_9ACTN|nr:NUDIX hydrolase [Streptomyces palmae]TGB16765.1 NUDIX hydrolase [Streptomyces palmae]